MALSNAEKQRAHRERQKQRLALLDSISTTTMQEIEALALQKDRSKADIIAGLLNFALSVDAHINHEATAKTVLRVRDNFLLPPDPRNATWGDADGEDW